MRAEDVLEEWVEAATDAWRSSADDESDVFRLIVAAVAPLIAAQERERCARVVEQFQREVQGNIDDNIAEVRVVETKPSDNWPLIKARDWLRHSAAAIRALGDVELPKNDSR